MASQNQIPASLPDTQNTDGLPSQSVDTASQQPKLVAWGRLCSTRTSIPSLDMKEDISYTVGRSVDCNLCLTLDQICLTWLHTISKIHFRIYRERIQNTNEIVVYLEDLSSNGTFVNKARVGRGNRVIIEHLSEIALSRDNLTVFLFLNINAPEIACQLQPELKQNYAIGRKLGAGACGEVRLLFTKDGSKRFALKIIQKNCFDSTDGNILNNPANVKNEVDILKKLKHPCIIHLEDIHDTPKAMYIILELMEGGELFEKIKKQGRLSESCAKLIFYQVVLAVHYLHKMGITHRDLKPENILLKDHSDNPLVKVSDFGMSKFVNTQTMMRTFCGTPMYVAPEILATRGRSSYTSQIRRMMTVDPKARITVPQILLHPWLRDTMMRMKVNRLISNFDMGNDENIAPANVNYKRPRLQL
ncbi:PREDICTED: ovarian-specific serine/threonine-protein kinase Lok isoform X2 [Vollenhovia emeryi]|uniref:ovarian-specific serine/threonine-protein kinase Lok isoform X2 n=1 Tax=Vollenhovia emeryi TaxID=411798 RepID=UPI0005F47EC5|nr:PREDICTED: ovarian-specific serine/threonine-protein kinase Lok isoform X2 [Vollenhovia emeryi]